ncbi:hypothetical protein ES708_31675 [subsurface metagenome]|jgi:ABC-type molybdate transport system substrate-binding protein
MTLFPGKGAKKVSVRMRKALWLAISLLVVVVLLVGGCAGHPKGMKSLRWLTDAEKERVIEIALNTPEALSLLEKESQYETSVNWVAINWLKNGMAICGFDYECVDKGIPATVPESAEFYSQVEIYIGEPAYYPKYLLRVAINPDTGEVAHVQQHGLKKLPTAPGYTK